MCSTERLSAIFYHGLVFKECPLLFALLLFREPFLKNKSDLTVSDTEGGYSSIRLLDQVDGPLVDFDV
jgi:hypothetical protein